MKTRTSLPILLVWALAAMNGLAQPVISVQPANATVELGQTYTNGVVASSGDPITYEWYFDGALLDGQISSSLTVPNIQTNKAGNYWVVVTDFDGSVTSRVATLFVGPGVTFTKITQGDIVNYSTTGSGCAWGDYDKDGFIDLFVTGGTQDAVTNNLYHNNGDGTFTRMPSSQVGDIVGLAGDGQGCAWADYDNDGWLDMMIASYRGTLGAGLLRNNGNGTFSRVPSGVTAIGYGVSWADYDGDGWVDLLATPAVGQVVTNSSLYHNQGDGTFTQVTTGTIATRSYQYLASWSDMDNDGDLDVATTDFYRSHTVFLNRNEGGGQFTQISDATLATPFVNQGPACPSWGDYDNDGMPDLFLAGWNQASRLYRNTGGGHFTNVPFGFPASYTNQETRLGIWGDYDNDGDLDLFVTGGYTIAGCKSLLFANNGDGSFTQILGGSPVNDVGLSSACLWGDYDNDGFLDLFVKAYGGQGSRLYRSNGNGNSWLMLKLEGTASNRAAIGAKIRVLATLFGKRYWQMREISGGHVCQNDLRAHFGLGDATKAEIVRVEWPSGHVTEVTNVAANQILSITEPPGVRCAGWDGNGLCLAITGNIGERYELKTSSDIAAPLSNWVPWLTNVQTSRTVLVTNTSPLAPQRFHTATPLK